MVFPSSFYLAKGEKNGLFHYLPGKRRKEWVVQGSPFLEKGRRNGYFHYLPGKRREKWVVPGSLFPGKRRKVGCSIIYSTWLKEEGKGCSIIFLAKEGRKRGCSRLPFPWQRHEGMGYSIFTWQKEEGMGCSRRPSPWQRPGGMGCSCPSSRPACGNLADPAEVHRPSLLLHHPTQGKWIVPVPTLPSSVGRFLNPDLLTCELD